jgi:hypothetical protein
MRRDAEKRRRANRTPAEKQRDNNATRQWRHDNEEYVKAIDHFRHADQVAKYTKEEVEEKRVKARNAYQIRIGNELQANPINGVRVPMTGDELQKKCVVLSTLPPELITDALDCGLHVMICARKSWRARAGEHIELEHGNQIMLRKFIDDFVSEFTVLTRTSVVWHGRAASDALPWIVNDDDMHLPFLDADLWNENTDRRFANTFSSMPDNSTVLVVVRGIDGASVNVDSWIGLQTRYTKLNIILVFTCAEVYVRFRAPVGHDFFYRTDPYDERLYGFFPLSGLINHVNGTTQLEKYAWLLSEWRAGTVSRQAISIAYQSQDQDRINRVMADYGLQRFRPRNGLPATRHT